MFNKRYLLIALILDLRVLYILPTICLCQYTFLSMWGSNPFFSLANAFEIVLISISAWKALPNDLQQWLVGIKMLGTQFLIWVIYFFRRFSMFLVILFSSHSFYPLLNRHRFKFAARPSYFSSCFWQFL